MSSLNPCFNGRYSQSKDLIPELKTFVSLNPCFNGRYSQRKQRLKESKPLSRLNPCFNGRYSQRFVLFAATLGLTAVLILVLMEDTLRAFNATYASEVQGEYLNPCFNGRYSQRLGFAFANGLSNVLILVLMEDTLRVLLTLFKKMSLVS